MNKVILHYLGYNKTITASMEGKVYCYEYKRSFINRPNISFNTYSDNELELKELYEKENQYGEIDYILKNN